MQWIPGIFRRNQQDADLSEELTLHLEERTEQLQREGLSSREARRQALIAFGNPVLVQERSRQVWQWPNLQSIWSDIRFALRQLRRSPDFTLAAVLTLALAIGANAVVFSILNAFLLRPLNVAQPDRLYQLQHANEPSAFQSYPNYLDLRDLNRSFESLVAYTADQAGLDDGGGEPSEVWLISASSNYFDALGLQPYLGHFFHAADEHGPNSAPYIVLNYEYWHTHFQDDRSVIGRVVYLNRHPFTIEGVAPPDFRGTLLIFDPAMWVPIVEHPLFSPDDFNARAERWVFETMGYLKPGVTPAQAVADLDSVGAYLEKTYPKDESKMTFKLNRPGLYGDYLGKPVQAFMTALMLLTGLILLAACANLGSLFAARAADRSREVALRLALGATRTRILRGLFTEAILISLGGGAVGIIGSVAILRALTAWRPFSGLPMHLAVNPDANVYVAAVLLAIISGLLFGAVPVRQVLKTDPYGVVKQGSVCRRRWVTAREVLLLLQIAICAVLVTSSLVSVRGLIYSLHARFGFDMQNTMLAETDLSMAGYTPDKVPAMQKRMLDAVQSIPHVDTAAFADILPFAPGVGTTKVFAGDTSDLRPINEAAHPALFHVSPGYFRAAGTALLAGRDFTWHDDKTSPQVAIVNPELARKLFGSPTAALGGFFKLRDGTRIQIIGIAEQGKYQGVAEEPSPALFVPILQSPATATTLVVHTSPLAAGGSNGSQDLMGAAIRDTLHQVDPALPLVVEQRAAPLAITLFGPRMATIALGVLGLMGAMLSITGIFGMAAYSVSRRLKEFGIRVALGAQRRQLLQAALGRALKLLAFGSLAGLTLGLMATKILAFIVYQATPGDPLILSGAVLAMALLGLIATWIPAQRALSVNPLVLLREE